jgi:hypothetical protein
MPEDRSSTSRGVIGYQTVTGEKSPLHSKPLNERYRLMASVIISEGPIRQH